MVHAVDRSPSTTRSTRSSFSSPSSPSGSKLVTALTSIGSPLGAGLPVGEEVSSPVDAPEPSSPPREVITWPPASPSPTHRTRATTPQASTVMRLVRCRPCSSSDSYGASRPGGNESERPGAGRSHGRDPGRDVGVAERRGERRRSDDRGTAGPGDAERPADHLVQVVRDAGPHLPGAAQGVPVVRRGGQPGRLGPGQRAVSAA